MTQIFAIQIFPRRPRGAAAAGATGARALAPASPRECASGRVALADEAGRVAEAQTAVDIGK